ncbi:hypothetical protein [Streptomyces sp. NPDC001380]|uniref:hypothetical protein n=1 Tax=Streptomyces sp. NPDC001380 TaxID=3364566 RepID=UPI0036A541FE
MTAHAPADVATPLAAAHLEGRWTGHSLRRGLATAARRAGHDLERIGRHGGRADGSRALPGHLEDGDRWERNPVAGLRPATATRSNDADGRTAPLRHPS